MAAFSCVSLQVNGSVLKPFASESFDRLKTSLSSTFKVWQSTLNSEMFMDIVNEVWWLVLVCHQPFFNELHQLQMKIDVSQSMKNTSRKMLDAFVDSAFQFVDQPLLPSQVLLLHYYSQGNCCFSNKLKLSMLWVIFSTWHSRWVHGLYTIKNQ